MTSNGRLLHGLPIAVDLWRLPKSHEKFKTYLYFLTHLHTDHTQGLTSTWTETIYTSKVNADLAVSMLKVKPELIQVIEIGSTHLLTLPSKHGDPIRDKISVTPIDANHIRGSVMFLFEGYFGRILYTGDFRLNEPMLHNPTIKMLAESKNLDVLYVDNTFEDVGSEFPTREQAMEQVMTIVRNHKYHRIIFGCQTIGKEDVLLRVAQELKESIYVPSSILENYRILGLPVEVFTTNQSDSQLWFEQLKRISHFDLKNKNLEVPTIAIALTAAGLLYKSNNRSSDNLIYTVPYSNHCSASELQKFLNFLKPKKVERIVQYPLKTKETSVVSNYIDNLKILDETSCNVDDAADEAMEVSADEILFKSQVPDRLFPSAIAQDMEQTNVTIPSPIADSPLQKHVGSPQKSPIFKASKLLDAIFSDLDNHDESIIYSDDFVEKLITLTRIHQTM